MIIMFVPNLCLLGVENVNFDLDANSSLEKAERTLEMLNLSSLKQVRKKKPF